MPEPNPTELLRPGLLDGVGIVLAAAGGPVLLDAASLEGLGATVRRLDLPDCEDPQELESKIGSRVEAFGAELEATGMLLVDGGSLFGNGGETGLGRCLACTWSAVRALAGAAFLTGSEGGRIVLLAPRAGLDRALAAAAGLENLARTLSIEWARFGVTTVAVAPGQDTSCADLTMLAGFLASSAGSYYSGCLMDLRGPTGRR